MLAKNHTCCFLEKPPVLTHRTYSLEYVADVMNQLQFTVDALVTAIREIEEFEIPE